MTNTQTGQIKTSKQAIIDRDEFREIWRLSDKDLLQRVKTDLGKADSTAATKVAIKILLSDARTKGWQTAKPLFSQSTKFPKLTLPELLKEDPLAHVMALILDHKRLDFTRKFASATQTTAPKIALDYLEGFGQLLDEVCKLYCKNKKEFLKLLKKHARISEGDLTFLVGAAQQIYPLMITILGFHVPLSLLILFLKWVLDKFCRC